MIHHISQFRILNSEIRSLNSEFRILKNPNSEFRISNSVFLKKVVDGNFVYGDAISGSVHGMGQGIQN